MIQQHTIKIEYKGDIQDEIEICTLHCPTPNKKCKGECEFYKEQVKKLRQLKKVKKKVVVF